MSIVVMGVAGSGKSTIGTRIATALGVPFVDGDDLHPAENKAKMASGVPLTDADRVGWLAAIRKRLDAWATEAESGVVACSALKRSYREVLRDGPGGTQFVFLDVPDAVLMSRLAARTGHFMPAKLLASQLADLERPDPEEHVLVEKINRGDSPEHVVDDVLLKLRRRSGAPPGRGAAGHAPKRSMR